VGFRYYYGQGSFKVQDISINSISAPTFDVTMNITEVSVMECFLMDFSVGVNTCVNNDQVFTTVNYVASTPALSLLLRLSPIMILID
jgi:hypothetical protein